MYIYICICTRTVSLESEGALEQLLQKLALLRGVFKARVLALSSRLLALASFCSCQLQLALCLRNSRRHACST